MKLSAIHIILALAALILTGCATQGPLHVYSVARDRGEKMIADRGGENAADTPSYLEQDDRLTGFAYDPFTDHFFLRLAPGNKIRVVDRPARKIKREYEVEGLATGGDLALIPRTGHLFFLDGARVVKTSRLGKVIETLTLEGAGTALGLAADMERNQLLALHADGRTLTYHDLSGRKVSTASPVTLAKPVTGSLAFDYERRELYAPLQGQPGTVGIFDAEGKFLRDMPLPAAFIDLGPRSFLRLF